MARDAGTRRVPATLPDIGVETDDEDALDLAAPPSRVWRQLRADPSFWTGALVIATLIVLAAGAGIFGWYDPNLAIRGSGLTSAGDPVGPGAEFWLGTDRLGRDYWSRLLHGARTSLTVGIGANLLATVVGTIVGSLAALGGTRSIGIGRRRMTIPVETLLMRFTDVVLSLPALLLAIALVAIIGPSLLLVVIVIGALLWTGTARIVYGRMRLLRELEFVVAARALDRPRTDEPADRPRALHQREDRRCPRLEHPGQAGRDEPCAGRRGGGAVGAGGEYVGRPAVGPLRAIGEYGILPMP